LIAYMPFPIGSPLEWSLNPAVFEILRTKRIEVTSLTYHSRSRDAIAQRNQVLPLMVSEIFNAECNTMVDIRGAGSGMPAAIPIQNLVWRRHTNQK